MLNDKKYVVTFQFAPLQESRGNIYEYQGEGKVTIWADSTPFGLGERYGEFILRLKEEYACEPADIEWDSIEFFELSDPNPFVVDMVELTRGVSKEF